MKFKKFGKKWVVSINIGEEVVKTLKKFIITRSFQ